MTQETLPDSPDNRKDYGARSALSALIEENFFQTERTPNDARTRWQQMTGTKLNSRHMCVAIYSAFKKGNLTRASKTKLGHTYVTSNAWKERRPN